MTQNMEERRWADQMSDTEPEQYATEEDICDHLLHYFPVPGEIWVHLRTQCNYLSSLLSLYASPPPAVFTCV